MLEAKTGPDRERALLTACKNADWMQVVLNQGPPCFHLEGDQFCLRAKRWAGHDKPGIIIHEYVSLHELISTALREQISGRREK